MVIEQTGNTRAKMEKYKYTATPSIHPRQKSYAFLITIKSLRWKYTKVTRKTMYRYGGRTLITMEATSGSVLTAFHAMFP